MDNATARTSFADFVAANRLTFTAVSVPTRPDSDWEWKADHFLCTISTNKRSYAFYYSMGIGHRIDTRTGKAYRPEGYPKSIYNEEMRTKYERPVPPKLFSVFSSLVMDAQSGLNADDYAEFASEFGYDVDSIKGRKVWKSCRKIASKLKALLGYPAFRELMDGRVELED